MSEKAVVVIDTNIVLDLFLFQDPRTAALRHQLISGGMHWWATPHMRNELQRVLTYSHIAAKLAFYEKTPAEILAGFDRWAHIQPEPAARAPFACKDADDQVFIDLACAIALAEPDPKIQLISKDKAILSMRKRLEKRSVIVTMTFLVDKNVTCRR